MVRTILQLSYLVLISLICVSCTPTGNNEGNTVGVSSGEESFEPVTQTHEPRVKLRTHVKTAGMVVAANPHAVEAGLDILRQGGSAVDAAIAVQAMLGLVEPQSSGIGGGAFMLVFDPESSDVWVYDGRETAPQNITPELFYDDDGEPLRYFQGITSGRSTGVPGVMPMLGMAHADYGKIDWSLVFEPAIKLADAGFEISPRLAGLIERVAKYGLNRHPETRAYFFASDGQTPLPEGYILKNPNYANSLRALQESPRALLQSPLADKIIEAVQQDPLPGTLSLEDMARYKPRKRPALCSEYREHILCSAQPPSSGGIAVQSLMGVLENFDMASMGPSLQGWHSFVEASFLAYADRDKYVADDSFVDVPVAQMLDDAYLKTRADLIMPEQAIKDVKAGEFNLVRGDDATPDSSGTSHFTIVDASGLTVSMTTTVESAFGSQRMVEGFMLNNQLTDFSFRTLDAEANPIANAPEGGKRPRSSMSPFIVFDEDGRFLMTTGSPGGSSIIAYTAKTLVAVLDWGFSPQDAIALPNVIARNGSVRIEENRIEGDILSGLEAKGHNVVRSEGEISGLHIIYAKEDGTLIGGADPRREGVVGEIDEP